MKFSNDVVLTAILSVGLMLVSFSLSEAFSSVTSISSSPSSKRMIGHGKDICMFKSLEYTGNQRSTRMDPLRMVSSSSSSSSSSSGNHHSSTTRTDNKAMSFLRKVGRVGGKTDFTNALGVDEGTSGKAAGRWSIGKAVKKSPGAYRACTDTGVIDNLSETFPITCSGTEWAGVTDKVMGGHSSGTLARETYHGRSANVLRAHVSLENGGGFVQMATDLSTNPAVTSTVDVSNFDGVEAELYYDGSEEKEDFNIHLKNASCERQFSSYRSTFSLPRGVWKTIRIPWKQFNGYGWGAVENNFDPSSLRRLGIVSIGKEVDVTIAVSSVGFYHD